MFLRLRILAALAALLFVFVAVLAGAPQSKESPAEGFLARSYHSSTGESMQYRLFVPPGYDGSKKYPIVLWLHDAGGRGSDNLKQISGGNFRGSHVWTTTENQAQYQAFMLAPQVDITKGWARPHANAPPVSIRLALEILDAVEKALDLPVDALAASREVLSCFGNMSSATVMFVLKRIMQQARPGQRGCAMSFGPGLTAETMRFHAV